MFVLKRLGLRWPVFVKSKAVCFSSLTKRTFSKMASYQEKEPSEVHSLRKDYFSDPSKAVRPLVHLDVRDAKELKENGYILNTLNVPLAKLNDRHLPEDKEADIVISCARGARGAKAADLVCSWGYKNVYNLKGGLEGWKNAGMPVSSGFEGQPFVKCFYDKPTGTCQYVVTDESSADKETIIIDPVLDFDQTTFKISYLNADNLLKYVNSNGLKVTWILETHAHADHLTASQYLKSKLSNSPKVAIGEGITQVQSTFAKLFSLTPAEISLTGKEFDHLFKSGETFPFGTLNAKVLHVPGHTPDHLCYLIGESVFAGDSIFMPDSGSARCDFPGGSATLLFKSIRETLFSLPDSTRIFVGHDYQPEGRKLIYETTVAEEKQKNKHLKLDIPEAEFIKLREERDKTLGNPKLLYASLQVNIRAGHLPQKKSELQPSKPLFVYPVDV